MKSMKRCVVVAPVGPNPAAIAELVWHLASAGTTVAALHLVLESERSRHYVDKELLGPGRALCELRDLFGDRVPVDAHLVEASTAEGFLPIHERHPDVISAMSEPLWTAARNAQRQAGDAPVVFGLTGGRRRVSTAIQTAVYQLLGRTGDRLVDVRVSLPVAAGGTQFFFPEQTKQQLVGTDKTTTFVARDVVIWVEPVDVPRLRPLLQEADLATFSHAKAAAAAMVADASPPAVEVDVWQGVVRVDGRAVKMPRSQVVAYQLILAARARGESEVETVDFPRFRAFTHWRVGSPPFLATLRGGLFDGTVQEGQDANAKLMELFSKMRRNVQAHADKWCPAKGHWLVPRSVKDDDQVNRNQLALPPGCIIVIEGAS